MFPIFGMILSFAAVWYRHQIIDMTGRWDWAEKYLGVNGSKTALVLFAIFLFFWCLTLVVGEEKEMMGGLGEFVGGKQ